jgi:hypothetical protein
MGEIGKEDVKGKKIILVMCSLLQPSVQPLPSILSPSYTMSRHLCLPLLAFVVMLRLRPAYFLRACALVRAGDVVIASRGIYHIPGSPLSFF